MARGRSTRAKDRPFTPVRPTVESIPAPSWVAGGDPTCALPAPTEWPEPLKRFVVAKHESPTWAVWCRPFHETPNGQEAVWLALRTAGAHLRGGSTWKIITNDEAWHLCSERVAELHKRSLTDSATTPSEHAA